MGDVCCKRRDVCCRRRHPRGAVRSYVCKNDTLMRARRNRMEGTGKRLYHVTSSAAASRIKAGGNLLQRGADGAAGAGMYFATSREHAVRKCQQRRGTPLVCLTCEVSVGIVKKLDAGAEKPTFTKLLKQGYDSVLITNLSGDEYVVYNWDQVSIQSYDDMGNK
eukprot:NODE_17040_length_964_cov_6.359618.p2 GENE.NODE_17040_length_964_cov_6.359618~~NODE_17040_length_964_cov_6.359618.p2  ORF type:complete len:164 (-),score=35.69 NODE_17040_length_964_cov_6.359618:415-906(-)